MVTRSLTTMDIMVKANDRLEALKAELKSRLAWDDLSLTYADSKPSVWLFVGVNGVGKTTTIGKLGTREVRDGRAVVMAAGDTFRAAAAEQLGMWAERAGADLVRGNEGGDPSAVIFDAIESAAARDADLVLADTAGRLHTKANLMEELKKVRRVAEKGAGTVTEVLLVLDATTGQNGLVQAQQFTDAADLTGVVLTKLDGDARGGAALSVASMTGRPIMFASNGEKLEDFDVFHPERMASRILGMGDMLTLIEQAEKAFDAEQASRMAGKLAKGDDFTLEDFLEQMMSIKKMGSLTKLLGMLPGMGEMKAQLDSLDDRTVTITKIDPLQDAPGHLLLLISPREIADRLGRRGIGPMPVLLGFNLIYFVAQAIIVLRIEGLMFPAWLAVAAQDFGQQRPREGELMKAAIERLEVYFKDALELASETDVT